MKKYISMIGLLVIIGVVNIGCSSKQTTEDIERDNLGNIGKIMRTAEYQKVIKDYTSIKNNEHNSEQLEIMFEKMDNIVSNKNSKVTIDVRIGNYGDVEVRQVYSSKEKSLIGVWASEDKIEASKTIQNKDGDWDRTIAIDNGQKEEIEKLKNIENNHGLYLFLDPKIEKINSGTCLGEVSGKTYIICNDAYGRQVLYVIGFYENKKYKNDWDMNILQFISDDGTFSDNCRDVYNIENAFIFKDGSIEANNEVARLMNQYSDNELYKTVKKEFK